MLTHEDDPPEKTFLLDSFLCFGFLIKLNETMFEKKTIQMSLKNFFLKCSHALIIHQMSMLSIYCVSPFHRTNEGISDDLRRLSNMM